MRTALGVANLITCDPFPQSPSATSQTSFDFPGSFPRNGRKSATGPAKTELRAEVYAQRTHNVYLIREIQP